MIINEVVKCPYCGEEVIVTPSHEWQIVWCAQPFSDIYGSENKGCYKDFAVRFKFTLDKVAKMEEVKLQP